MYETKNAPELATSGSSTSSPVTFRTFLDYLPASSRQEAGRRVIRKGSCGSNAPWNSDVGLLGTVCYREDVSQDVVAVDDIL